LDALKHDGQSELIVFDLLLPTILLTMDPLKYSDLRAIDDWAAFKPDMKGYIAPQELALWPDCETIRVCRDLPLQHARYEHSIVVASVYKRLICHPVLPDINSLRTAKSQIRKFTRPQNMRDNDAPFIALRSENLPCHPPNYS
jgi:hypothetical protein